MPGAAAPELLGCQQPTHSTVPPYVSTSGGEAADLAALAGVTLDPWQRDILDAGLGERPREGSPLTWSAGEIAMILSRQNGKNVVFEARELFGLFLLKEPLILHTAHQYKTSQESFRSITGIVGDYDWFRRKVLRVVKTNGEEAIELRNGARLRFLARSVASGRGFRAKTLILDEAYALDDAGMGALLPTLSAQSETQLWYGSSAGRPTSVQLARIWRRIRAAVKSGVPDPYLAGFEWAAEICTPFCRPDCAEHDRLDDPQVWAKTNPGLGIAHSNDTKLAVEAIEREYATLCQDSEGRREFARERLGVGDYPSDEAEKWEVISEPKWLSLEEQGSQAQGELVFAVEVGPERRTAAIGVAAIRDDERLHVEVIGHQPGTDWVAKRIAELWKRWRPFAPLIIDPYSHAGALIEPIKAFGVPVIESFLVRDQAQACGMFYDAVQEDKLRHIGQGSLTAAVAGAKTRPLADSWAWDRKNAAVDISPLTAVTLAAWGLRKHGRPRFAPYDIEKSVG